MIHGQIMIGEIILICGDEILTVMKIDSDHVQYDIMYQLQMIGKELLIFLIHLVQVCDDE